METLKINNKENIANSYGLTPTLPFDVEGVLVEKKGKDLKIEKTIDNKTVQYSLRVKEDIVGLTGETIKIDKENIVSAKVEEKEDKEEPEINNDVKKAEDIIRDLGLESSEENIRAVKFLIKNGIPATKENIMSYLKSKEYLEKIVEELDINSYAKLMDRGISLEDESLQKIAEALDELNGKNSFSLRRFLRLERDLTYKEAEEISREIYGQKMGKDVYDGIIALHREKIPITKENISKILETMSKIFNLKDVEDQAYVNIIKEEKVFNIDNLFKLSNYYTNGFEESNIKAEKFVSFTVLEDTNIGSLKEILKDMDLEVNDENIKVLREFIVNNMAMDKTKYEKIMSMKNAVKELMSLGTEENIAKLYKKGVDILKEDIGEIVEEIKREGEPKVERDISKELTDNIKKELENIGKIEDRDLLLLIKNEEDFTLKNIREIIDTNMENSLGLDHRLVDKVIHISNIFNAIGENLNPKLINFTLERYNSITLENLHVADQEIKAIENPVAPVENIDQGRIFEEYHRARNDLTINMVRDSIKENKEIENMPLGELNNYIQKKLNKYSEGQRIIDEIKAVKGNEDRVLPTIIKNQQPMTPKEIKEINEALSFMDNSQGESGRRRERKRERQYIEIEKAANGKDLVFQLPVNIDENNKDISIIVPNIEEGIEKEDMKFYLDLETKNLGKVSMEISVKGQEVQITLEQGDKLAENLNILENSLNALGYTYIRQVTE